MNELLIHTIKHKSQEHYAEWKKYYIKKYMLYSFIHVKFYNRQNLLGENQNTYCLWRERGQGLLEKGHEWTFQGDSNVLWVDRGLGCCSHICMYVVDLLEHLRCVGFIICKFYLTFKKQRAANKYKTLHKCILNNMFCLLVCLL